MFNKLANNFGEFFNRLSAENLTLKNMLKTTESKLRSTQKKLKKIDPRTGPLRPTCNNEPSTERDRERERDRGCSIAQTEGNKENQMKLDKTFTEPKFNNEKYLKNFCDNNDTRDNSDSSNVYMKLDLIDLDTSHNKKLQRKLEFEKEELDSKNSLFNENQRLKKQLTQTKIKLSQVQQKIGEKIDRKVKEKLEDTKEAMFEKLNKQLRMKYEQEFQLKHKKFIEKVETELKKKFEQKFESRMESEGELMRKKLANKMKLKFEKELEKSEIKFRKKIEEKVAAEYESKLKGEVSRVMKDTYIEWKGLHQKKLIELEQVLNKSFEARFLQFKEMEAKRHNEVWQKKMEEVKQMYMVKAKKLREYFEQLIAHRLKEKEISMRSGFEYQKKMLKIEFREQLQKIKKVIKTPIPFFPKCFTFLGNFSPNFESGPEFAFVCTRNLNFFFFRPIVLLNLLET